MKKFLLPTLLCLCLTAHAQCDAPQVIPYYEDFTDIIAPNLPACTASGMQTFVGNHWITSANPGKGFTGNVLYYNSYSDENWSMSATFSCRPVYLEAGISYKISYKYTNDGDIAFNGLYTELISHDTGTTTNTGVHENITGNEAISHTSGAITVPVTGSYTLLLTASALNRDSNLFVDDIAIEEADAMGTETAISQALGIYPNPVKDIVYLPQFKGKINIFDNSGKIILTQNTMGDGVDVRHLAQGIYFLEATSADKTYREKFIKQ